MGDLNAQIDGKRDGFQEIIGPYGSARGTNDNGERFISFCNTNGFVIGNTQFQRKKIHKNTWRSPNGYVFNEIDYICISKKWRGALQDVRTYRGADIGSDHYLVAAKMQLRLEVLKTQKRSKPYDIAKLKNNNVREKLEVEITNKFHALTDECEIEQEWNVFKDVVLKATYNTVGKRRGTREEQWIRPETYDLIDKRRNIKMRRDTGRGIQQQMSIVV